MHRLCPSPSTQTPLVLATLLFCVLSLLSAACGTPPNPACSISPPTGYPSLTTVGGLVYLQSDRSASLYALRSSDGSLLWKYKAGTLLAVEHGIAYVQGTGDTFYALHASDGSVLWHYDMSKDVSSIIAVVDGLVYFTSSNNLTLYTLRASDGRRLWQHQIDADHFPSIVLAGGGVAYVAAEYSRITALRESDGSQLWQDDIGALPPAGMPLTMMLENGLVYAVSNQTTALNASDGKVVWNFAKAGPLVVGNSMVYVSSDQVYALRASDGTQVWRWQFPSSERYALTLVNGIVYAGPDGSALYVNREHIETYKERLYALKGSTGAVLWNHTLGQSHTVLAVSGGVAYALSQHALDAWQAGSGSLLWHHALQQVGLLVDGATVYAGTAGNASDCFPLTNSKLTALRATDGSQLWQFESGTVNSPTLN